MFEGGDTVDFYPPHPTLPPSPFGGGFGIGVSGVEIER